jgi:hypothetical protein
MAEMMKSEKNFLERLADAIPGLKGYRSRDDARETDKRLREYLANRLDTIARGLDGLKLAAMKTGGLEAMNGMDTVDARLSRVTSAIRYAKYGFSGMFDQVKINEPELAQLYDLDTGLIGLVDQLDHGVKNGQMDVFGNALAALETQVQARTVYFDTPRG